MKTDDFYKIEHKGFVIPSNVSLTKGCYNVYKDRVRRDFYKKWFDNLPTFAEVLAK